jgi:ABC-type dipeptide/oligopeptide/nickel transport system permease subunit
MRWRLLFLGALLLPDLALEPFRGGLGPSLHHPLGTDDLGRDALLRLLLASARSLGFASACALLALALGLLLAWRGRAFRGGLSALRSLPPLLFLLPLAASAGGLKSLPLGLLLGLLIAPHLEPALRTRLEALRHSPAWAAERCLGASSASTLRRWAPWGWDQAATLFPSAWLAALWGEATLSALGLGPGPGQDSLGRLLSQELPRLGTDPSPLAWASLALVLALAWGAMPGRASAQSALP